jgi:tripartite-type tricarboxylate transporter receptor subunit TctC
MTIRKTLLISFVLAVALGLAESAMAQVYPSRPLTMIVPYPAGGSTDTVGRIVAERMRSALGQSIIIENVSGASGSIGVGRLARAPHDGYTFGMGTWPTHVLSGAVMLLPYDVLNDFEPIGILASEPYLIVTRKDMPANNLRELIAWLKANPGTASLSTIGPGSSGHVAGTFFQKQTGTHFQFVPYRGVAPAMQDLVGGRIDMMFDLATNSLPQVRAGAIKAYAVMKKERWAGAPDFATVDEAGLPGFYFSTWHAFFAPRGTPRSIIAQLDAAVIDALADPVVRQRLADFGQEIPPREQQTPEALGALQKAEIDKWWPIIKAAGIKME